MALTGKITLKSDLGVDLDIPDAYVRVSNVRLNKSTALADIEVKPSENMGAIRILYHGFDYDLSSGKNAIAQAYESMKQSPVYHGMTDA